MLFNTNHHIRTHLDKKSNSMKKFQNSFSLPISLRISLRRFLEANFELKSCSTTIFSKH
eukprot:UN10737